MTQISNALFGHQVSPIREAMIAAGVLKPGEPLDVTEPSHAAVLRLDQIGRQAARATSPLPAARQTLEDWFDGAPRKGRRSP